MSINHEVKGSLARLLATENLIVEHKKVSTASFDVNNRVLVLPLWNKASSVVYDMLVGHEVGHALYTPNVWDFLGEIPKDYVNVIEDARIEKLMKRKYPGLAKSFYKGYNELNDEDFFCIKDTKLNTLSLIDRINLHFKIGAYARIPFGHDEEKFVEMTEKSETFEDVLNVCRQILQYIKEKKRDSAQVESPETPQAGSGDSQGESSDQFPMKDGDQLNNESGDDSSDNPNNEDGQSYGGTSGSDFNEEISQTQRSFDDELKDLTNNIGYTDTKYIEVPDVFIDKIVVNCDDLHRHIDKSWYEQCSDKSPKYWGDIFSEVDSQYQVYKNSAQKEVNYLVKEFECKKSADSYSRSSVSRTGVLDCSKLHTYKYNEDLFRKVSVIPDGKNHGLIFILDWSGSMSDYILDTVKQLFNLVWFCKKVQIPFEVYAFTYDFSDFLIDPEITETPAKYERKKGSISIHKHFHLLNFLSSKTNSVQLDHHLKNIWRLAHRQDRSCYSRYSTPLGLELSGTPLDESIICLHKIIPQFKSNNKLQKVNVVILTDGEANGLAFDVEISGLSNLGLNRCGENTALRDRKTGHVYRNFSYNNSKNSMTTILLENLKHNFPEVNCIGFRILSGYEFNSFCRRNLIDNQVKLSEKWKKEKSVEFNGFGYSALFAISSTNISKNSDFDVDQEASNQQIGKAFRKMLKTKSSNKKILSSFISYVS